MAGGRAAAVAAVAAVGWAGAGAAGAAAALVAAWTAWAALQRRRLRRTEQADVERARTVLEVVAVQMHSGSTPLRALSAAAEALAAAGSREGAGGPREGAAGSREGAAGSRKGAVGSREGAVARAARAPDAFAAAEVLLSTAGPVRALGSALRLSLTSGASLAVLSDGLAQALRAQLRATGELRDALAATRASVTLLSALPLLGLVLSEGMGAHPVRVLRTSAAGHACLVAGTLLTCLGQAWTARLVERARAAAVG